MTPNLLLLLLLVLTVVVALLSIRNAAAIHSLHSRLAALEQRLQQLEQPATPGAASDEASLTLGAILSQFEARLSKLERPAAPQPSAPRRDNRPAQRPAPTGPREVYFGNVKGHFFNDVYDCRCDEAKFKAVINGNEGHFEPITLDRIKSLDNIDRAVTYQGSIQLNAARTYSVMQRGTVVRDGDVWIIQKPAVLKLM